MVQYIEHPDTENHSNDCAFFSRTCVHCNEFKWGCEFYKNHVTICKSCYKKRNNTNRQKKLDSSPEAREKYNAYMRERNARISEEEYINRQCRLYGITYDDYLNLLKEQDGKCAICREQFPPWIRGERRPIHIDHNHETGKARGLLCPTCNLLLGHSKEKIANLVNAVQYLLKWEGESDE